MPELTIQAEEFVSVPAFHIFWLSADRLEQDDAFYPQTDEDWDRLDAGKPPEYRRCRFPEDIDGVDAFRLHMT